jgi:hypothetical protein
MLLTNSIAAAALEWFGDPPASLGRSTCGQGMGYAVGHGPHLAPGEHAEGTLTPALSHGERESYSEVVLVGRLREAIRRLNPAIACGNPHPASPKGRGEEARTTVRQYRRVQISTGRETMP